MAQVCMQIAMSSCKLCIPSACRKQHILSILTKVHKGVELSGPFRVLVIGVWIIRFEHYGKLFFFGWGCTYWTSATDEPNHGGRTVAQQRNGSYRSSLRSSRSRIVSPCVLLGSKASPTARCHWQSERSRLRYESAPQLEHRAPRLCLLLPQLYPTCSYH